MVLTRPFVEQLSFGDGADRPPAARVPSHADALLRGRPQRSRVRHTFHYFPALVRAFPASLVMCSDYNTTPAPRPGHHRLAAAGHGPSCAGCAVIPIGRRAWDLVIVSGAVSQPGGSHVE